MNPKDSDLEDIDSQEEALEEQLQLLSDDELISFSKTYDSLIASLNHWDLWQAAFFISGGCSDDGFTYFRNWVLGLGEAAFASILQNPDNLADFPVSDPVMSAQCAEWDLLPGQVWESRDESRDDNQWFDLVFEENQHGSDPAGSIFAEDDLEGFKKRFPRLAEVYKDSLV